MGTTVIVKKVNNSFVFIFMSGVPLLSDVRSQGSPAFLFWPPKTVSGCVLIALFVLYHN